MIKVRYLGSFDDSFEALNLREQRRTGRAVSRLLDYFSGGPKPLGLGLRKLRANYWEIRSSLDKRVLFLLEPDTVTFVIAGNHDDIRRHIHRGKR